MSQVFTTPYPSYVCDLNIKMENKEKHFPHKFPSLAFVVVVVVVVIFPVSPK